MKVFNISNQKKKRRPLSGAIVPAASILLVFIVVLSAIISTGRKEALKSPSSYAGSIVFEGINVDPVIARNFGVRRKVGVLVASEPTGYVAKSVGLCRGDIITALNDIPVADVSSLMDMMGGMTTGSRIQFSVTRNGRTITLGYGPSLFLGSRASDVNTGEVLLVLAVFFAVFLVIFLGKVDRTVMVSLGAVAVVIFGTRMGFFDQMKAFSSINLGTLSLLVGMGFFSIFFNETKLSGFVARKIALFSGGEKTKMILFLCCSTFVFSMLVNNIAAVLIIVPITLKIADDFNLKFVPLLICEVIASNLGGAASMIGDFPNMLISSEGNLLFHDFLFFMFPVCFIQLLALFVYIKRKGWIFDVPGRDVWAEKKTIIVERMKNAMGDMKVDWDSSRKGLVMLALVIIGFVLEDITHISSATVALGGGFILLAFGGVDSKTMLSKLNIRDILFFGGLFVMVGALDATGALTAVSQLVRSVSGGNLLVQALLVLWISAFLTAFFNAGPTAALFIPVVFGMGAAYPHDYIWWALSLGVLAGSCATLTGATAGAVTVTLLDEYKTVSRKERVRANELSFRTYTKTGVPIMFLFLGISTIYIMMLSIF